MYVKRWLGIGLWHFENFLMVMFLRCSDMFVYKQNSKYSPIEFSNFLAIRKITKHLALIIFLIDDVSTFE